MLLLRYNKVVICVQNFLHYIDKKLENVSVEPIYHIDYNFRETDNNNQIISKQAAENYAKNRCRCSFCKNDFCKKFDSNKK